MHPRKNERIPDEKLDPILLQLRSIRRRLNSLAIQHAAFYSLAALIGVGAIVYLAAFALAPITFMIVAIGAAVMAPLAIISAVRTGWAMHVTPRCAASLADDRAELKGRLATIVSIAPHRRKGPLWSYLLEDTLSLRDEFTARRIERRRISKGVFALAASLVIAGLAWPLSKIHHAQAAAAASQGEQDLTLDLNDLHLRPGEPGDDNGVSVSADPATMRRLQEKLAREGVDGQGTSTSLDNLMNHTRDMASNLQDKLTGQKPSHQRLNLKLADAADPLSADPNRNYTFQPQHKTNNPAGQFQREQNFPNQGALPQGSVHSNNQRQQPAGRVDSGNDLQTGTGSSEDSKDASTDSTDQQNGDQGSNGGSAHGIGVDPDTLFGSAAQSKLGNEGFEIAIEARPLDKGPKGAGHAYEPPKVRTPLSTSQQPDEPVARTQVPPEDQTTIKRVFEQ
jgi:hypothetical protein